MEQTAFAVAFRKAIEKGTVHINQLNSEPTGDSPEARKTRTLSRLRILMKEPRVWEDPGFHHYVALGVFSKILHEHYYAGKFNHFEMKMIKKLTHFQDKHSTFNVVFSWYTRLMDQVG